MLGDQLCSFVMTRRWDQGMGVYGTMDTEFSSERLIGPITAHVDNKGIVDGLWRREMKCIGLNAKDADVWMLIWEKVRRIHQEGITAGSRALSKPLVTEGNAREKEPAKGAAMLDGGDIDLISGPAQFRREQKRLSRPLQHAAIFGGVARL